MLALLKRGLGVLGVVGLLGALVFMLTAFVEITTGHGSDPVPTAWLIEAAVSVGSLFFGGVGWVVLDIAEVY